MDAHNHATIGVLWNRKTILGSDQLQAIAKEEAVPVRTVYIGSGFFLWREERRMNLDSISLSTEVVLSAFALIGLFIKVIRDEIAERKSRRLFSANPHWVEAIKSCEEKHTAAMVRTEGRFEGRVAYLEQRVGSNSEQIAAIKAKIE
ncbi:MAG: hypothetical protein ACYS8Z_25845 [Planctomycetota bacterium]